MKMHDNISKRYISFCSCTLFAHTPLIFNVMVTRKYTFVLFCSHTQQETIHKQKKNEIRKELFSKTKKKVEKKRKDLHNNKKKKRRR